MSVDAKHRPTATAGGRNGTERPEDGRVAAGYAAGAIGAKAVGLGLRVRLPDAEHLAVA